jgi:hypothetical protein
MGTLCYGWNYSSSPTGHPVSVLQETTCTISCYQDPLKSLFTFPEDLSTPLELAYFWKGGIQNLEKEMVTHEILCLSQEHLQPEELQDSSMLEDRER